MIPKAFTSAQATLRVYGIVLIVVTAALSVFVGVEVVGPHGGNSSTSLYNVTYMKANQTLTGGSGTAPMRTTTDAKVAITTTNMTNVTFVVTWRDQSFSPLTNPRVTVTVTGPNGTGSTTNAVSTSGVPMLSVTVPNMMPNNTTVQAASPEAALAMAGAGNNATLGVGEWTVSMMVGGVIGPRPGGSISYSISVQVDYFVGTAKRA